MGSDWDERTWETPRQAAAAEEEQRPREEEAAAAAAEAAEGAILDVVHRAIVPRWTARGSGSPLSYRVLHSHAWGSRAHGLGTRPRGAAEI